MPVQSINIEAAGKIKGWMSFKELYWLAEQAKACKRILEIGSYQGRSTRALADNTDGIIFCVDPWNSDLRLENGNRAFIVNDDDYIAFCHNLGDYLNWRVLPYRCSIEQVSFADLDMVFIDGDHLYPAVCRDIEYAKNMIKKDGILAGHDYNFKHWPSVKKAVDEMLGEVNIVETIWWKRMS